MTRRRIALSYRPAFAGFLIAAGFAGLGPAPAAAEEEFFKTATSIVNLDDPTSASSFNLPPVALGIDIRNGVAPKIRCSAQADQKGVRFDFQGQVFDADEELVDTFDATSRTQKSTWTKATTYTFSPTLIGSAKDGPAEKINDLDYLVLISGSGQNNKKTESVALNCTAGVMSTCDASSTTACLNSSRFQVEIPWEDPFDGSERRAFVGETTSDSALFVFSPLSEEVLVEVVDLCDVDGHFSFSANGATSVEMSIRITDTETGQVRLHGAPPADGILDSPAFFTCP